jgi:hypothetical protein
LVALGLLAPQAHASVPGPAAGILFLDCGEVVGNEPEELVDFTLGNNLICTSGDALTIIAPSNGITIDLGGHRLQGDGGSGEDGVVFNGTSGVTVRNGVLTGFDRGVVMNGTGDIVEDLTLVDNNGDSVQVVGSNNVVRDSQIMRGGNVFLVSPATGSVVSGNTIVDESVVFSGADVSTISGNQILGGGINAAQGADGSALNDFLNNAIACSADRGDHDQWRRI